MEFIFWYWEISIDEKIYSVLDGDTLHGEKTETGTWECAYERRRYNFYMFVWKDPHLSCAISEETWRGESVYIQSFWFFWEIPFSFLPWVSPAFQVGLHKPLFYYFIFANWLSWFLFFRSHPLLLVWYDRMSLFRNVVVSSCQ